MNRSRQAPKLLRGYFRRLKGALLERRRGLKLGFDLTDFRPVPLQIPLQRSFTGFLYKK
jgi:hypothetical protein